MVFAHDTELSLQAAVLLANSALEPDTLTTVADLDEFLRVHPYTGGIRHDEEELAEMRGIRERLSALWGVDREGAVTLVNAMLHDGGALPRLVIHDDYDWHVHATSDDAPLATRILVEAAMAFVDVIRSDEYGRVRVCDADDCESVYIDMSRNGSKRYCDTGNCGNRMNVIAYRKRQAERESA